MKPKGKINKAVEAERAACIKVCEIITIKHTYGHSTANK